jgi:hypothetical protein
MKSIAEITNHYGPQLATMALDLGAIKLQVQQPFTWASRYRMPIYNDNRRLLASPKARSLVCDAFCAMLDCLDFDVENIAGTATAAYLMPPLWPIGWQAFELCTQLGQGSWVGSADRGVGPERLL